ncbi:hypothetical protein ACFOSS_04590 [Pseudaeromonas sharmana]|uniref:Sugar efflux transporter for intercellular exchange n=1 Tax=Pseudaeromonas sharmana TaxID=328412 RepID=A0ABV8CKQ5_9GAMM
MQSVLINRLGWFASLMAMVMYASYLDQIRLNISGASGSLLLPIAATINCLAWVGYSWLKPQKDWPMLCCNALGVVVCGATVITALL